MTIIRKHFIIVLLLIFSITIYYSCSSTDQMTKDEEQGTSKANYQIDPKLPEWVNKPQKFSEGDHNTYYYAVGMANQGDDIALARDEVSDSGRVELAKYLESWVASLTKDYVASSKIISEEDKKSLTRAKFYEKISKSVTEAKLTLAEVLEYYTSPNYNTYALLRLKRKDVLDIETAKNFKKEYKKILKGKALANMAADELAEELEKLDKKKKKEEAELQGE